MKTFILEGVVTALTSINHNGGESFDKLMGQIPLNNPVSF